MGNNVGTSKVTQSNGYNIVKVGNVEPVVTKKWVSKKKTEQKITKNMLFRSKCKCYYSSEKCKCVALAYYENTEAFRTSDKALYEAFCSAYNTHEDVILSPDDVWMTICLQFTKYVNANAEKMRHLFVDHEGKKQLTVTTANEINEDQWTEFFELMLNTLKKETNSEVSDLLQSNFSTTGEVEKLLSTAVMMNTFKQYFSYGRCIPWCGIRNVMFMGTLEDWTKLLDKLTKLKEYSVDSFWTKYIDELIPVVNEFIETYQGRVNADFWDKVMNIRYGSLGSGSTSYVSGWILKFYGLYKEVESDDIKEDLIDVVVEIDNKLTGEKKDVNIVGGVTGISKIEFDEYVAYKPQMSFIVYHNGELKK